MKKLILFVITLLVFLSANSTESMDAYKVYQLYITTTNGSDITSKENYTDCTLSLDGQDAYPDLSVAAQIRGRGNSSWLWYAKKSYRLKLEEKKEVLGLAKAKSWVLLANYRDVTDLMNTFAFAMGHKLGLPFTNHTRYVELYLNGNYKGVYQLTEQVQQNKNRVNVSDEHGILISLDVDDGPAESPNAVDNFWSKGYRMPVAVKYPDDEYFTPNTCDSVKAELAKLEQAIKAKDYPLVEKLLDIPSFIKYLQIQEFVYNVELSAPRSIYMHKDGDGKWFMGPLWDFDAGYDFDWANMTTGHTFFTNYRETVMGSDPLKRNGNYSYVPQFFTDLFGCPEFVKAYKAHWASVKDSIVAQCWDECMAYVKNLRQGPMEHEERRWPISGKHFDTEVEKMHQWLLNRCDFMSKLIANIPEPAASPTTSNKPSGTKTVYIPEEWKWSGNGLYKESDPNAEYNWSKTRSIENDDIIIFWEKGYGNKKPSELAKNDFYYVDIDDLLKKCQEYYDLEYQKLGFVDTTTTNLNKYKMMVLILHSSEWACYGAGYDFQINALWVNPAPCKPVGHSVAHEVGHSFHYMCFSEHNNHQNSTTDNTGFHLACGNGQAIWEQTAQWQACQSYPEEMFSQSYGPYVPIFRHSHNYAFSHEWHRYQSYWFHYYLCDHYNDITTVAQVWNQPMVGQKEHDGSDFNMALMALKNLSVRDLYALYFDYACRCVTWDYEVCKPYRDPYIGNFEYRCVLTGDHEYQVALASCPQGTGFNVIPLEVPVAGTEVTTHLTGLAVASALLDADPGEYYDGNSVYTKIQRRNYVNGGARAARGFRMGYVALMKDGTRQYFSEDSVYCQGTKNGVTEDYRFTVPEGVSRMWLVVSPALKSYQKHKWDDTIEGDDMWPYCFRLEGTDIDASAVVYASPTLDDRAIADVTFTYDVTFPADAIGYSGTTVSVSGNAAATLGTAFQMQTTDISSKMMTWSNQGPGNRRIMFYAANADGTLAESGSTANGYGHWFNASGTVCSYSAGHIFSEFSPSSLTFTLGQYPGRCAIGSQYTIRQALRYRKTPSEYATAMFVFNISIADAATVSLKQIDYTDPSASGIIPVAANTDGTSTRSSVYNLQGQSLKAFQKGINIVDGKKILVK